MCQESQERKLDQVWQLHRYKYFFRFQSYSGRGCCVVVREVRRDETSSSNASLGFSRNHLDVSM
jgi:hypothetical protein